MLTIVTTTLCYVAAGATTGLFFGGVAFATFLAPPLILARHVRRSGRQRAAVVTGTAMVWAVATGDPYVTAGHWAQCVGALIAYVVCPWGVVALLHRLRLPAVAASAIVVVIAGLWLTWPIWLSPWIAGRDVLVARLTIAHPLLTIDSALITLGPLGPNGR